MIAPDYERLRGFPGLRPGIGDREPGLKGRQRNRRFHGEYRRASVHAERIKSHYQEKTKAPVRKPPAKARYTQKAAKTRSHW